MINNQTAQYSVPEQSGYGRPHHRRHSLPSEMRPRMTIPSPTDRFLKASREPYHPTPGFILGDDSDDAYHHSAETFQSAAFRPPSPSFPPGQTMRDPDAGCPQFPGRGLDDMDTQDTIKRESLSDVDMRSSRESTIRPHPTNPSPRTRFPPRPYSQPLQDDPHIPAAFATDTLIQQRILFEKLLEICIWALQNFWLNEACAHNVDSSMLNSFSQSSQQHRRARASYHRYRHHPYETPADMRFRMMTNNPSDAAGPPLGQPRWLSKRLRSIDPAISLLFAYLALVTDALWTQAKVVAPQPDQAGVSRSAQTQAVHRMHNLYIWAGRVVGAVERVRAGELVRDEEVFVDSDGRPRPQGLPQWPRKFNSTTGNNDVNHAYIGVNDRAGDGNNDINTVVAAILAARDICSWCLSEDGQRAVEQAWEEWAVSNGGGSSEMSF